MRTTTLSITALLTLATLSAGCPAKRGLERHGDEIVQALFVPVAALLFRPATVRLLTDADCSLSLSCEEVEDPSGSCALSGDDIWRPEARAALGDCLSTCGNVACIDEVALEVESSVPEDVQSACEASLERCELWVDTCTALPLVDDATRAAIDACSELPCEALARCHTDAFGLDAEDDDA